MDTPEISFPVNIEQHVISGNLNSAMLQNFLLGMYTIVYGGTVYIYLSRKPSNTNNRLCLGAISVLYLLSLLNATASGWYYINWSLIVNGDTRDSMFLASLGSPVWELPFQSLVTDLSLVVSDALLIWRCFHVWGQSIKIITIPSLFLVAELGLSVTHISFNGVIKGAPTDANAILINNIRTALIFISLGTTVSVTFLIGYRIHTASGTISGSKRRYNHIVSVIVESNAVYSLVLLVEAIITVVPGFSIIESPAWPVSEFIDTILFTVTGLIPTVMIARLALTSSENSDSSGIITHVSALDFSPDKGSTRNVDALSASGEIMNSSHSMHGKSQHEILMIGSEKKPDDSQV